MDPNTWYVSLPNGLPRISSPIILKRDTTTLTYLANKRSLQGLSLQMTRKLWKLHQQSFTRRTTIIKLITGWNVGGSRYALYIGPTSQGNEQPLPPMPRHRLGPTLHL